MRKMPNDVERLDRISSAMDADENGNITAGKDVKVDGKLTLKSLISDTNPDGDITKELGGSNTLYEYLVVFNDTDNLGVNRKAIFYSSVDIGARNKARSSTELYKQLIPSGSGYNADLDGYGCVKIREDNNDTYYPIVKIEINLSETSVYYLDPSKGETKHPHTFWNDRTKWNVIRNIASPRKAN